MLTWTTTWACDWVHVAMWQLSTLSGGTTMVGSRVVGPCCNMAVGYTTWWDRCGGVHIDIDIHVVVQCPPNLTSGTRGSGPTFPRGSGTTARWDRCGGVCWWKSGPKGGLRHNSPLFSLTLCSLPRRVLLPLALRRKMRKQNNTRKTQGNT
jgi:hypothetical protein